MLPTFLYFFGTPSETVRTRILEKKKKPNSVSDILKGDVREAISITDKTVKRVGSTS